MKCHFRKSFLLAIDLKVDFHTNENTRFLRTLKLLKGVANPEIEVGVDAPFHSYLRQFFTVRLQILSVAIIWRAL